MTICKPFPAIKPEQPQQVLRLPIEGMAKAMWEGRKLLDIVMVGKNTRLVFEGDFHLTLGPMVEDL